MARLALDLGAPGAGPDDVVRVYEAGCGEGLVSSALQRVADGRGVKLEYAGSDLSEAAIAIAQEAAPAATYIAGDATEVTAALAPAAHDVVLAKNLLHHIDDPGDFLAAAGRAAGPDGRVVVVEARLACVPFFLATLIFAYERERHFFKGRRRNLRAFADAGLTILHEERFSALPYEYALAIRSPLFRRPSARLRPSTVDRLSRLDDTLARRLPVLAHYVVWVARAS